MITEKELLNEVSRELNIDIKDINRTYSIWLKYLEYISYETDQASLTFPHLGKMYVSVHKVRRGMNSEKFKRIRERKLKSIQSIENCKYNIHEKSVPIILKYGISKKNSIPFILGKTEKTSFYTINDIVNNQTRIFFKEDLEFRENEKLEKQFYRNND